MPSGLKRAIVSSGLVLLACSLATPTSASQRRGSTPLDFLSIRKASSPQISPDGETVVFVLEEPGLRKVGQPWRGDHDLWRVPADGSAPPQRWISSPQRDWSPRWSPDGGALAFLSKRGTGESSGSAAQIFLSDSSGAEVVQLTRVGGEISAFRWAPDGSSLAFLASDDLNHSESGPHRSNRPLPLTKLYQLSVSGDELTLISPSGLNVIDFDWSPDGTRIAALTSPTAKVPDLVSARQLVIIDPSLAEVERRFPNRIGWDSPVLWSPDGELIHVDVWRSPGDAWSPAFISASDGQTQVLLDGVRATIGDTRWSADSRFLFGQLLEGNQTSLARIERETGAIQRLTPSGARLFEKGTYTAHDSSGRVVLLKASASTPPDLWFVDSGQAPKQLTRLNPQIDQIDLERCVSCSGAIQMMVKRCMDFMCFPSTINRVAVTRW